MAHVAGVALEQPGAAVVGVGPRALAPLGPQRRGDDGADDEGEHDEHAAGDAPPRAPRHRLRPPFAHPRRCRRRPGGIGRRVRGSAAGYRRAERRSDWGRVPMRRGAACHATGARRSSRPTRPGTLQRWPISSPTIPIASSSRSTGQGRDAGSPDAARDPAAVAGLLRAAVRGADDVDARRGPDVLGRLRRHLGRRGVRGRQAPEPGVAHVLLRAGLAAGELGAVDDQHGPARAHAAPADGQRRVHAAARPGPRAVPARAGHAAARLRRRARRVRHRAPTSPRRCRCT